MWQYANVPIGCAVTPKGIGTLGTLFKSIKKVPAVLV